MPRQIVVEIVGNAKKFTKTIHDAENTATGFGAKLGVGAAIGAKAFSLLDGAVSGATQAIFDSIDSASDLQQSVGAVDSVFKGASERIFDFGNTAADSVGLSKRDFNEMDAVVGAQLKGMGFSLDDTADRTIELQKRAADMAATFGGKTSDAIEAISSLLRGERDPIEKYGVSIKEADVKAKELALGLDTSTASAKKQSDAIASMALLMEQTADSQGAWSRESDTLAHKQQELAAKVENLGASIGQKLLPVATGLADAALYLVEHFDQLKPVFIAVAGIIVALVIPTLQKMAVASWGALGPLGLIAGAAVALGITLMDQQKPIDEYTRTLTQASVKMHKVGIDMKKDADWAASGISSAFRDHGWEVDNATKKMADTLPKNIEEARKNAVRIVKRTPSDIASALREQRTTWQTAVNQLQSDLEHPMSAAAEYAALKAELTGDNIRKGLKSKDPVVRAQAEATRDIIVKRMQELAGQSLGWGEKSGLNLGKGLNSKRVRADLADKADKLAGIVKDHFKISSPAKKGPLSKAGGPEAWGEKMGLSWNKGFAKTANRFEQTGNTLAGLASPSGHSGGGRGVTIRLEVDGRTLAEIVDRNLYYQRSGASILGG